MKIEQPARPRGRPRKAPVDGERPPVTVRFSAGTKRRLQDAADRNGWTLSQEADFRVAQSFAEEAMVGSYTAMLFRQLAIIAWSVEQETGQSWRDNHLTARAMRAAVNVALDDALAREPDDEIAALAAADVLDRATMGYIDPATDAQAREYAEALQQAHELGVRLGRRAIQPSDRTREGAR